MNMEINGNTLNVSVEISGKRSDALRRITDRMDVNGNVLVNCRRISARRSKERTVTDDDNYDYIKDMAWKTLPRDATMALIHAVKRNCPIRLKVAIDRGAVAWVRLPDGGVPIIIACRKSDISAEVVSLLLDAGCRRSLAGVNGISAREYACESAKKNGRQDIMDLMMSKKKKKKVQANTEALSVSAES